VPDVSLEEDHGDDDDPEIDEALDPEFEPVFEVDVNPEDETRDIHEADTELEKELEQ